jgi:lipoprotein-anchoring transpeptidase ErfK/SrfK
VRAFFVALLTAALAGCSAQLGEVDFGDLLPGSLPRQASESSYAAQPQQPASVTALNELDPDLVFNSLAPEVTASSAAVALPEARSAIEPGRTQEAVRGSSTGGLAKVNEPADDPFVGTSAYAPYPRRVAGRTYVKMSGYAPGTLVVRTRQRRLYLLLNDGRALRYPVAVGKAGQEWTGASHIYGKRIRPPWMPPSDMKRENPALPEVIPGGSPSNPMGDAALLIAGGEYAIHGTNRPESIGRFVSYGCIRMYNEDILDLYQRVSIGTTVVVER